ncbi:glycosyltransferase family 2 protein [Candidatus Parcubacteria bacterium]|nr:MAG: glycosyltransferase family 2 protein [Candidatus Parcubacteria bacterium]
MKAKKTTLSILIPAYNEEENIEKIIKGCQKLKQYELDILVAVDGKTTDNTYEKAEKLGVRVIKSKSTGGKGITFREAIKHLRGDYVIQIDADYQFLPDDIPKLMDSLQNGCDVALGTRYRKGASIEKGSVSLLKRAGSFGLSFTTSIFTGQRITDVMAGFKGFKRKVLIDLDPQTDHFGYEAELVIKAAKKKYKIREVPINYKKRITGNSSIHLIKHGILTLSSIIRVGITGK